jgi:hypothetical protein
MNQCTSSFYHKDRPRNICELNAGSDGLCIFHSDNKCEEFPDKLIEAVKNNLWLEGAKINCNLIGATLNSANLPYASFSGEFIGVDLSNSILENAIFIRSTLSNVFIRQANCKKTKFYFTNFKADKGFSVDFTDTELGGCLFSNTTIQGIRLAGASFSFQTDLSEFLTFNFKEFDEGLWNESASIYSVIGKRAFDDGDDDSASRASYQLAVCRHRFLINAGIIDHKNFWNSWIRPTIHSRKGYWLLCHRYIWGYGLLPIYVIWSSCVIILLFALFIYPWLSFSPKNSSLLNSFIISINTFAGIGDSLYKPDELLSDLFVGTEALLGNIMVSLFLVTLVGKYFKRY